MIIDCINELLIEATHRCQAKCPGCHRTWLVDHSKDWNHKLDISMKVIENIASSEAARKMNSIKFNGSFGDAILHPQFEEIAERLSDLDATIMVCTNGSMRNPEYFANLAKYKNLQLRFAIDGLEDTHSLYRINTKFENVINNAQAFIDAGGDAHCHTILFPHMIHQATKIKEMAVDMGFNHILFKNPRGSKETGEETRQIAKDNDVQWWGKCTGDGYCKAIKDRVHHVDVYGNFNFCGFINNEIHEDKLGILNYEDSFYNLFKMKHNLNNNNLDDVVEYHNQYEDEILLRMENKKIPICNATCYNPLQLGNY